jgi:hypothetical protein
MKSYARYLLLVDSNPVHRPEPLVALDVVDTVLQISESLRNVNLKQVPQQVLDVCTEMGRESNLGNSRWKLHKNVIYFYNFSQSNTFHTFIANSKCMYRLFRQVMNE